MLLAATTVPVHALVLGPSGPPGPTASPGPAQPRSEPLDPRFWAITAAFTLVTMTCFSVTVLLVTYLTDHGWTLPGAAFAAGTLGAMQLPGRLAVSRIATHLPKRTTAAVILGMPAVGVALLFLSDASILVWPAVAVLGTAQGALLLFKATLLVELYGTDRIGRLNGVSAVPVTTARALEPLAATFIAARSGYAPAFLILIASSIGGAWVSRRALPQEATA